MAFLRLLLYGGFIFITAIAFSADENTEDIIDTLVTHNNYVIPTHYNVKLIPYFKEDEERDDIYLTFKTNIEKHQTNGRIIIYGEINATIHIFHPIIKIILNSSNSIHYLSAELIERDDINLKLKEYYTHLAEKIEYDNVTQNCVLHFEYEILPKKYVLNIKFLNTINTSEDDNIFLKTTYIKKSENEKSTHDKTHFPTIEAQRLFPCWDKPAIKATFNVSIKHHCNYSVFSNMPIERRENAQEKMHKYLLNNTEVCMQWTYFGTTPSMPAHLVMVMITSMHFFPSCGTDRIYIWRNPNSDDIQFAERVSNKVIMKLKFEWFRNLKIPKLQLVAIPEFRNDINMNFGFVAIRETSIIYNENLHSIAHKIEAAWSITRGIVYQWFGNLINPSWWSKLWLNDGLITLLGMDVMNAVNAIEHYKNSEILDLLIVQTQYESLQLDDCNFTQSLLSEASNPPEINSLSSFFHYLKAPLILRMLQHLVTKKVFWKSVGQYLNMHVLDWISDDLWLVIQDALYETYPNTKDKLFLKYLVNGWTKYVNYPTLKIVRNYSAKRMHIAIENYDFLENNLLWIPVTFTTQSHLDFTNVASPLDDERLILISSTLGNQIDIVEDGWVIFNLQQVGYYRVNYDSENWQRIAKYLNSREYTKIHVLNRAKIIDDAFRFMITQQLDSFIFWNLTSYLAQETNYIAWYPMIKAFEYMSSVFPFIDADSRVNIIKNKLNYMLRGLLSKIKYKESSEEDEFTKCLRQEAIKWACIIGDTICQRKANDRLLQHIGKLKKNKLLPWWEEWIYCKGSMLADHDTWHKMKNMALMQNRDNRFLEFLACSKYYINEYLELITPHNGTYIGIQAKNCINSFLYIIAKHAKHDYVFMNILTNFEKLKPKDISALATLTIIINHVYSKKQLDEIKNTTTNIIEKYAFDHITEILYKDNKTYEATAQESFKAYTNLLEHWKWCIERKVEIRLSQIRKHVSYLQKFINYN